MDTSVNPQVSYGVTIPYNQKIISEEGTWSADGKIYTVTHEVILVLPMVLIAFVSRCPGFRLF